MLKRRTLDWYTPPTRALAKVAAVQQLRPLSTKIESRRLLRCRISRQPWCASQSTEGCEHTRVSQSGREVERPRNACAIQRAHSSPIPSCRLPPILARKNNFVALPCEHLHQATALASTIDCCMPCRVWPSGSRKFPRHSVDIRAI